VAWTYPHSGLSITQIADRIAEAASAAGVSVYQGNATRGPVISAKYPTAA